MSLPDEFVFSQSNLQDFRDCPRRFQLRHIKHLRWPAIQSDPVMEQEKLLERGADFHHLIHQHIIGVPTGLLTRQIQDDTLREWWNTYLEWDWLGVPPQREPEITLSVPLLQWRLMAKFDVIASGSDGKTIIIDWKTSSNLPKVDILKDKMQTIVYPYVLAKAGDTLNDGQPIQPENIRMMYWYPATGGQHHTFIYDTDTMLDNEAELLNLVQDIAQRAEDAQLAEIAQRSENEFPMTEDVWKCKFCEYRSKCDRGREAGDMEDFEDFETGFSPFNDFDVDLDQIAEVEF